MDPEVLKELKRESKKIVYFDMDGDMDFDDDELNIANKICGFGLECKESKVFHKLIQNFVSHNIGVIYKVTYDEPENIMHVLLSNFHSAIRIDRQFIDKIRKSGYKLKFHCNGYNNDSPLQLQISGGSASEPTKRSTVSSYYINDALFWFSENKLEQLTLLRFHIDNPEVIQNLIDSYDSLKILSLQYLSLKCEPQKINVPNDLIISFDQYTSQKLKNMFIQ